MHVVLLATVVFQLQSALLPLTRSTIVGQFAHGAGTRAQVHSDTAPAGAGDFMILRCDLSADSPVAILWRTDGTGPRRTTLPRCQFIDGRLVCAVMAPISQDFEYPRNFYLLAIPFDLMAAVHDETLPFEERVRKSVECRETTFGSRGLSRILLAHYEDEKPVQRMRITFDVWGRGGKCWEVFVADPTRENRLTREDYRPEREKKTSTEESPHWEITGEWTFDWSGHFYVVAVGEERMFVTDAGKVYRAPRGAKPRAALIPVAMPGRVEAIIHDSDAKKWYGFTDRHLFEFAERIQAKPHGCNVTRSWRALEAVETAAECGFVIRNPIPPAMSATAWGDLASPSRRTGHLACWAMIANPAKAMALLRERLAPVAPVAEDKVAELVATLGDASFANREAAEAQLRSLGRTVRSQVSQALHGDLNAEARRRATQLLADLHDPSKLTADERRAERAVLVLDRVCIPEARALLTACAAGADGAVLTRAARKALR